MVNGTGQKPAPFFILSGNGITEFEQDVIGLFKSLLDFKTTIKNDSYKHDKFTAFMHWLFPSATLMSFGLISHA